LQSAITIPINHTVHVSFHGGQVLFIANHPNIQCYLHGLTSDFLINEDCRHWLLLSFPVYHCLV